MFLASQGPIHARIELGQRDIAVVLPVLAEEVIKTQGNQDARIAAQAAGEVPAQL